MDNLCGKLLKDRRVLITGSARGIGLAVAGAMLEAGARVLLSDKDGDIAVRKAKQFSIKGLDAEGISLDISSDHDIAQAVEQINSKWGALDVLVNNAAMLHIGTFQDIKWDEWQKVLDVNITGAGKLSLACLPLLQKGNFPCIINTLSTQALTGQPGSVAYATAKAGAMNLTRCMAIDLGKDGIRVNAVAPGFIDTRMALMEDGGHEHDQEIFLKYYIGEGKIPLRRPGTPGDCAGTYLFLASSLSCYITGQLIAVDGGLTATY